MKARNFFYLAATAAPALAHPGHAPFSEGTAHFFANPNHFGPWLFLAVAFGSFLLKKRAGRILLRGLALMAILVAAFA